MTQELLKNGINAMSKMIKNFFGAMAGLILAVVFYLLPDFSDEDEKSDYDNY